MTLLFFTYLRRKSFFYHHNLHFMLKARRSVWRKRRRTPASSLRSSPHSTSCSNSKMQLAYNTRTRSEKRDSSLFGSVEIGFSGQEYSRIWDVPTPIVWPAANCSKKLIHCHLYVIHIDSIWVLIWLSPFTTFCSVYEGMSRKLLFNSLPRGSEWERNY